MEEVYLKRYNHYVTETINFKEKFKLYLEALGELPYIQKNLPRKYTMKALMDVEENEYKELLRKTNPHYLDTCKKSAIEGAKVVKGFRIGYKSYDIMEDAPLQTLSYLQKCSPSEKMASKRQLKYPGEIAIEQKKEGPADNNRKNFVPFKDFLLTLRVYMACKHRSKIPMATKTVLPQVGQEILISSQNTLFELRDRIACHEDFQDISSDISDNPLAVTQVRAKDVYKSGMFYIGNTFYTDNRQKENIDYSEVIRKWAKMKNLDVGETETMGTKVGDLTARLGYPYLYMHQGSCEHLIVITDARLVHPDDCRLLKHYPLLLSFRAVKGKSCQICSTEFAKFIVTGSDQLIYDSAYLCPSCTIMYHYNGLEKVGNFTLHKYIDRIGIL